MGMPDPPATAAAKLALQIAPSAPGRVKKISILLDCSRKHYALGALWAKKVEVQRQQSE